MANKKNKKKSAEEVSKETVQPDINPKDEGLEKRKKELSDWTDDLNDREVKLSKQEADLNDWAKELEEKAKKGKGKTSKEDATYTKKLSNCFLNGTVEEYIRTSAEQFEGEARHNFLNALIEGAEAVKANT